MKPKPKSIGRVCCEAFGEAKGTVRKAWWYQAARAVIREYERRQWRSVSEGPKEDCWVLVAGKYHVVEFRYTGQFPDGVTHWRPMPKGPR